MNTKNYLIICLLCIIVLSIISGLSVLGTNSVKIGANVVAREGAQVGAQFTKSSMQMGQQIHRANHAGKFGKEFKLPSGKRIDFLDIPNKTIFELKPFNQRAIKQGEKQLQLYLKELQSPIFIEANPRLNGIQWKTVLDTY